MWLLAAAHVGAEGRVRVFDVTGVLSKLAALTDAQLQSTDMAAVTSGIVERTRAVGFEIVLLFRHFVRRNPVTGASPVAGCQLFVAAGAAPLGTSPDTMQLRAVACRASPLKVLMSVALHDHAVLHEPVSVFTGRFDPSESCDIVDTRMAGVWRSVASMPFLRSAAAPTSAAPVEPLAAFDSPKAAAGRPQPAPDGGSDSLQELVAVVAMDDVHICRLVNRDNKAHNAVLRLSRLFSLGVGKGAWGGFGCATWAPRSQAARYRFPILRAASSSLPPPSGEPSVLAAAFLAASWNSTVHVFAVPPKVSASPPDAEDKAYLQPQAVVTFSLAADEVAADLLWLRTVTGTLKLAVVAIPALPAAGASTRGDGAIILPTLYLFDVRSGAREEVLELSAVMPERPPQAPLARALADMTPEAGPALAAQAHRVASDLNASRAGADSVYRAARGEAFGVADTAVPAGFHMLADDKIVAVLAGPAPQLQLHFASHLSWRAQADVLEAIAEDARDAALTRWEMCLQHSCRHWLRLRQSAARSPGAAGEAAAVQERVAAQLAAVVDFLEPLAQHAAQRARHRSAALPAGGGPPSWHPPSAEEMERPGLLQLAAFASLATLLAACGAETQAGGQGLYRRLCAMGFRPVCVLAARRVLRAGLQPRLPPDFIDDAVAVVLGAAGAAAPGPAAEGGLARRQAALQEMFLCMHDTAATDINRLVAACRDNHLWEGLIHAADLIRQPLLPAHDMLAAAAAALAAAPADIPDSGLHLLRYARACLLRTPPDSGRPQRDAHTAQMCMLAFLLWTTADYYRQVAPPALAGQLQEPYPVLQLLLRVDVAGAVGMFDELPLLEDGAYCGTDDVAAAIAPLGLAELHRLAPQPVLSLRQAAVNAFAELVALQPPAPAADDVGAASGLPPAVAGPLRLVCAQVGRSPPAVLSPVLAAACIQQLCAGGREEQGMAEAVASAVSVESVEERHVRAARGELAPALQALESARLWGPAALLYSRLRDLAGEMRCGLLHCQEVLQLSNEAADAAAEPGPPAAAHSEPGLQTQRKARLRDLVGDTLASSAGAAVGMREAAAHAAGVLVQRLLARIGDQLRAAGPGGSRDGVSVLQACAVELCRLEARASRLAGHHSGGRHTADLLLEHLPLEGVKAVALSSDWHTGGDLAPQLSLLWSIAAMPPPGHAAGGPVSHAARACQALAQDAEVQRELLARCCEFDRDQVVPYLRGLRVAAPPWAMDVARQHASLDGLAFLHHSAGQPVEAARFAVQHLAATLRDFRAWLSDEALPAALSGTGRPCAEPPSVSTIAGWTDLLADIIPPGGQLIPASSVGSAHGPWRPPSAADSALRQEPPAQALCSEGRRRVARIGTALATAQRHAAAPMPAPAEGDQPPATASLPPLGTWEQLFLLLLAELATAHQHAAEPHGDSVSAGPADDATSAERACLRRFFQLWAGHVVPLLDSAIKACIENGRHACLSTTLRALGSLAGTDGAAAGGSGEGGPAAGGGWEHLGALAAAGEGDVHEAAAVFGQLCLSAHRAALHLKRSQMRVLASDVVQLQGECLARVHHAALTSVER